MPHPAHPMASLSDARGNCARFPALLQTLLALLATLLARPRALAAAWHTLAVHATWDDDAAEYDQAEYDETSGYPWPEGHVRDGAYWAPLTHNHADCDPRILYVIGPRPNRGLLPLPRRTPLPRRETARAPPPIRAPLRAQPPIARRRACVTHR